MTVTSIHQVKEPQPAATATGNADEVVHIVSWWQWFLDMVLRLKVPRALCGVSLAGDPDRPDPMTAGAPLCTRCVELSGATSDEVDQFNHERHKP